MGTIQPDPQEKYFNRHPLERDFLAPFLSGFDVTYASKTSYGSVEYTMILLRPEGYIQDGFGLNREVLLLYSPFAKIDSRTIAAAEKCFTQRPALNRVDNLIYFLVSGDNSIDEWLRDYLSNIDESKIIVPFNYEKLVSNKGDTWFVRNTLFKYLYGRDLFANTLPLTKDTYFFGRQDALARHIDSIKQSVNRGIFGLRKTGKTSLLNKIERTVTAQKIGSTFFYDCKSPSIRKLRWNEFLYLISKNIAQRFKLDITIHEDEISIVQSFRTIMKRVSFIRKKVILIFDEIEYISFKSILDEHWHKDYIEFWQTIWAVQSAYKNLVFIIAGVNPSVVETDTVSGIQNPLFGIVSTEYLRGFSYEELKTMIKKLGKKMGIKFEPDAIEYLFNWYGGHPMLSRMACSWENKESQIQNKIKPINFTKRQVVSNQEQRDVDLTFYCKHVVSELKEFYPDEYTMLEMLSSGQLSDFTELSSFPEFVQHLKNYGLLNKDESQIPKVGIPVVGRYVGLELARAEGRNTIYKVVDSEKRTSWLEQRKEAILRDLRAFEKIIISKGLPLLFGPSSFPEADKFNKITVVKNEDNFSTFINVMNRCFVESIEVFGKVKGKNDYFWTVVKNNYPGLFMALHRIKIYRHEQKHIVLNPKVSENLVDFLKEDLENKKPSEIREVHFVLQQRIIDGLLTGIHIETNNLN